MLNQPETTHVLDGFKLGIGLAVVTAFFVSLTMPILMSTNSNLPEQITMLHALLPALMVAGFTAVISGITYAIYAQLLKIEVATQQQ